MAGYAIDIGDAGAVGVGTPSAPSATTGGAIASSLNTLSRGIFAIDSAIGAATAPEEPSRPTEGQIGRAARSSFYQALQELQGIEDPAQRRTQLNTAIATYEASGFAIGTEEEAAIERYYGQPIDLADPIEAAVQGAVEVLGEEGNIGYLLGAQLELEADGEEVTDSAVIQLAISNLQSDRADALFLTQTQTQAFVDFERQYLPRADRLISSLSQTAFSGLAVEMAGGTVSADSIQRLRAGVTSLRASLVRPSNVSSEQFVEIEQRIETLDGLVTQIEEYDIQQQSTLSIQAVSRISDVLLTMAGTEDNPDFALAAMVLTQGGDVDRLHERFAPEFQAAMNDASEEVRQAINSVTEAGSFTDLDFGEFTTTLETFTGIRLPAERVVQEPAATGAEDAMEVGDFEDPFRGLPPVERFRLTSDSLYNPAFTDRISDLTASDRVNLIDVTNSVITGISTPEAINDPRAREAFVGGVGQITATIGSTDEIFDPAYVQNVFSRDFFRSLDSLRTVDPEAHAASQARVQSAIYSQAIAVTDFLRGQREGSWLRAVDQDGRMVLDIAEAGANNDLRDRERNALMIAVEEYYNGDLERMIRDRGREIPSPNTRTLVTRLTINYDTWRRSVSALNTYTGLLRQAGGDVSGIRNIAMNEEMWSLRETPAAPAPEEAAPIPDTSFEGIPTAIDDQQVPFTDARFSGTEGEQINFVAPSWGDGTDQEVYDQIPDGALYFDPTGQLRLKAD